MNFNFRGKHWCLEKKFESFEEAEFSFSGQVSKSRYPTQVNDQLFPGDLDKGTPLVIKEGEGNKNTIIGTQ